MRDRFGAIGANVRVWLRGAAVAIVVLLMAAGASFAVAGDDKTPAAKDGKTDVAEQLRVLTAEVKRHKKAKDYEALDGDLTRAEQLYEDAAGQDKLRGQIVKLVGSMTKGTKSNVVAPYVLDALADIGDLRGAKYIKPYLKQRDVKVCSSLLQKAVAASADVPDACLVEPLLKIVDKSKTYGIAADAIESLARFKGCKKKRAYILERLVKSVKRSKPGGRPGMRGGGGVDDVSGAGAGEPAPMGQEGGATARWSMLAGALPGALTMLTGREVSQLEDWFYLVKENKGKLATLFEDD